MAQSRLKLFMHLSSSHVQVYNKTHVSLVRQYQRERENWRRQQGGDIYMHKNARMRNNQTVWYAERFNVPPGVLTTI